REPPARAGEAPPASGPSRPGREDFSELVGGRHLELIVTAVVRLLVRPPAQKSRRVTEALPLQMVVLDLAHPLDAERLPREILSRAPAAPRPGHAGAAGLRLGPGSPGMSREGVLTQRRQLLHQLFPHHHRER